MPAEMAGVAEAKETQRSWPSVRDDGGLNISPPEARRRLGEAKADAKEVSEEKRGKMPTRPSFRRSSAVSTAPIMPIISEDKSEDYEELAQRERGALEDLYLALAGDGWRRSGGWCSDSPLDEWLGIKLESGRVVEILLTNNNLKGCLPDSIQHLKKLKRLKLAENFLEGPLPDALGQCEDLEGIWLNDNEIKGELPDGLADLSQLLQLNLSENGISGCVPASWKYLRRIETIVMWGNSLSGALPWSASDAPNLRYLDLRNNDYAPEEKETIESTFAAQIPSSNLSL